MVTGDNVDTARAIAKQCGIVEHGDSNSLVMKGEDFIKEIGGIVCKNCFEKEVKEGIPYNCKCPANKKEAKKDGKKDEDVRVDTVKNKDAFKKIMGRLDVMARSRPEDKYAMVVGLIE